MNVNCNVGELQAPAGFLSNAYGLVQWQPVFKSILWDFEDLLVNDGCTGIAVLNPGIPQEVQFDEHKLLIVYGNDLQEYENIFASRGVSCDDQMRFITEAEHVHSSRDYYRQQFEQLRTRLGIDSNYD